MAKSKLQCAAIDYVCAADERGFEDSCGCGCVKTQTADPCAGLTEAQCLVSGICSPGYIGFCDCTCPGPGGYEGGGCPGCGKSCFAFADCVSVGE